MAIYEILFASLKSNQKSELKKLLKWNTQYHLERNVEKPRYFISEDGKYFVMLVKYKSKRQMEKLHKEWYGSETEKWFTERAAKIFQSGKSMIYKEIDESTRPL